jgi:hypothetical protein
VNVEQVFAIGNHLQIDIQQRDDASRYSYPSDLETAGFALALVRFFSFFNNFVGFC